MVNYTDDELLRLNEHGLIPGPQETYPAFVERVQACQTLRDTIEDELQGCVPFAAEDTSQEDVVHPGLAAARKVYGMAPAWIPIFFSNYKLAPWHGGCAWIFQVKKESPPMALLQLRRIFRSQSQYLGLYERDELISHECSHVGRMAYQEPLFEEIFAYQSSQSGVRRFLGPLLRNSLEALLLVGLFFFVFLIDAFALSLYGLNAYWQSMWWKLLPCGYLAYLLIRLTWRQRQFNATLQRLRGALFDSKHALFVAYRMSDAEILRFQELEPKQIRQLVEEYAENSLRWRIIKSAYFSQQTEPVVSEAQPENSA